MHREKSLTSYPYCSPFKASLLFQVPGSRISHSKYYSFQAVTPLDEKNIGESRKRARGKKRRASPKLGARTKQKKEGALMGHTGEEVEVTGADEKSCFEKLFKHSKASRSRG